METTQSVTEQRDRAYEKLGEIHEHKRNPRKSFKVRVNYHALSEPSVHKEWVMEFFETTVVRPKMAIYAAINRWENGLSNGYAIDGVDIIENYLGGSDGIFDNCPSSDIYRERNLAWKQKSEAEQERDHYKKELEKANECLACFIKNS